MTARGVLPGLIFIGIVPFDRDDEYTPFAAPNVFEPGRLFGGNATQYASYLAHTLKPYVDSRYRTLPDARNTGIMGFSLGGLISVYTALLFPSERTDSSGWCPITERSIVICCKPVLPGVRPV
ncbi:alpha/beta hydrolase-fold protein [Cohnella sp. LGH]|uniref:alpha/beta hydrolase-fold protein n=1 Tax=Cohnella sp. LGH TaxID=1619153 RepID=UPI001FFDFCA8|nr:alpha/beta hydrolase-fold protein [Cohnella sp. LGH]